MKDLTFAGDRPVVISYDGDASDIFNPIKKSSTILNVVDASILSDLYTPDKDGIKVEVKRNGEIVWDGFVMPNLYSQDLTANLDDIEIECMDYVSMLQYIRIDEFITREEIGIISLMDLVKKILNYSFSDIDIIVQKDKIKGYVNLLNFFDENKKSDLTAEELLASILRLFNLSIYYFKGAVYIVDFSMLSAGSLVGENINSDLDVVIPISDLDYKVARNTAQLTINDTYTNFTVTAVTKKMEYDMDFESGLGYQTDYDYVHRDKVRKDDTYLAVAYSYEPYEEMAEKYPYYSMGQFADMVGKQAPPDTRADVIYTKYGQGFYLNNNILPEERSFAINECLTFFAPNNGKILDTCTELTDLRWKIISQAGPTRWYEFSPANIQEFGVLARNTMEGRSLQTKYFETPLLSESFIDDARLTIDLDYYYSRTGFPMQFDWKHDDAEDFFSPDAVRDSTYYYTMPSVMDNIPLTTVAWTKNMIDYLKYDYIKIEIRFDATNGSVYYFNGDEWVETYSTVQFKVDRSGKNLFYDDLTPIALIKSDGTELDLSKDEDLPLYVTETGRGSITLRLPFGVSGNVKMKLFSPDALGNSPVCKFQNRPYYNIADTYKLFCGFPFNAWHHKAAHINFKASVEIKDSVKKKIEGEKDVRYDYNIEDRIYRETYPSLSLSINTYNSIVNNSLSYVLDESGEYDNHSWDERPELYVMKQLANFYGKTRKEYTQTIKLDDDEFNRLGFIRVPLIDSDKPLLVYRSEHDIKRNTIAVETTQYDMGEIENYKDIYAVPKNRIIPMAQRRY